MLKPTRDLIVNKKPIQYKGKTYYAGGAWKVEGKEIHPEATQEVYAYLKEKKASYFDKRIVKMTAAEAKKAEEAAKKAREQEAKEE